MADHHQHDTEHSGSHHHDHGGADLSREGCLLVILFNLLISLAEIIGGLISGSLALVSDAFTT
jgi:cobalt-zinc-cadmium efflux system protein